MNVNQFVKDVQAGNIRSFYYLYGEEELLFKEGVQILKECYLSQEGEVEVISEEDTLQNVLARTPLRDIFASKKIMILKKPLFLKSKSLDKEEEQLINYINKPASDICLIIFASQIDKRRKFFKFLLKEKMAYDFSSLKGRQLANWVKEKAEALGKDVSPGVIETLMAWTGENMSLINSELEKIALYLGDEEEITAATLELLVSRNFNVSIFSLVDALGGDKREEGIFLLKQMLNAGEPPLKILFMISRQLQLLYRTRVLLDGGLPARELPRSLSLAPFVTVKLARQAEKLNCSSLLRALQLARDTDYLIKTGQRTPALGIELLLLKI